MDNFPGARLQHLVRIDFLSLVMIAEFRQGRADGARDLVGKVFQQASLFIQGGQLSFIDTQDQGANRRIVDDQRNAQQPLPAVEADQLAVQDGKLTRLRIEGVEHVHFEQGIGDDAAPRLQRYFYIEQVRIFRGCRCGLQDVAAGIIKKQYAVADAEQDRDILFQCLQQRTLSLDARKMLVNTVEHGNISDLFGELDEFQLVCGHDALQGFIIAVPGAGFDFKLERQLAGVFDAVCQYLIDKVFGYSKQLVRGLQCFGGVLADLVAAHKVREVRNFHEWMRVAQLFDRLVMVHDRVGEESVAVVLFEQVCADIVVSRIEFLSLHVRVAAFFAEFGIRGRVPVRVGGFHNQLARVVKQARKPGFLRMPVADVYREALGQAGRKNRVVPVLLEENRALTAVAREKLPYCRGDCNAFDRIDAEADQGLFEIVLYRAIEAAGGNHFHTQRRILADNAGEPLKGHVRVLAGIEQVQQHVRQSRQFVGVRSLEKL